MNRYSHANSSVAMSVARALTEFLTQQWTVDDDEAFRTIPGVIGILGHGNVAGLGQALHDQTVSDVANHGQARLPYHQARNEQAMVHQAVGYARMMRRRATFAAAASVGPGSTNMLTGAALATANRLPALLLPSDTFATRSADPVLQQLELPHDTSISVNDAFRPLSRFYDRVERPEQLFSIALAAMRVLTDPAETGAVTISLPEDVQAETIHVPVEFLRPRSWHIRRPVPEPQQLTALLELIASSENPLIIAGGGVLYSGAEKALADFVAATKIPVGATQAGVGSLAWDHPQYLGAIGATGTTAANRAAANADLVIGIGTRYSDFTTASRTAFSHPNVQFANINVAAFDSYKHAATLPIVADARRTLYALNQAGTSTTSQQYQKDYTQDKADWDGVVDSVLAPKLLDADRPLPSQAEVIGVVLQESDQRDVIVQAAGSLPGDLHKLWRVRDPLGYHVEYAYSCMGYEIPGGMGARRAAPDRDVIVMVGDGSYLMMHSELATAVAEGLKIIVVLIQNHGYASIGNLSESVGGGRFGTKYRETDPTKGIFNEDAPLSIDLAANARSYGVNVIEVMPGPNALSELSAAMKKAKASDKTTVVHVTTDPLQPAPDGGGWWEVPVSAVSDSLAAQAAYTEYAQAKKAQRPLL